MPDVIFWAGALVALIVFLVALSLAMAASDADDRLAEQRMFEDWDWPTWEDRDA